MLNLDLSDNLIGYEGSRFIALALQENSTLETLNLKMNNIGDQGGAGFFKDLIKNTTLLFLGLAANGLAEKVILEDLVTIRLSKNYVTSYQVRE